MLEIETTGFDDPLSPELTRYINTLSDTLVDEALEIAVQFEDELAAIYNEAPPRGNETFIWSLDPVKNKKARGWWFWQLRQGNIPTDGSHYQRQGKPPRGGKVLVEENNGRIVIIFTNTWEKSGLLFGKLNGGDTRLPGHKTTGWAYAAPKFKSAKERFLAELFNRTINRRIDEGRL